MRRTAKSTTPDDALDGLVVMARMLRVPTDPVGVAIALEGVAIERRLGSGLAVAIGRLSSARAAGILNRRSLHPAARRDVLSAHNRWSRCSEAPACSVGQVRRAPPCGPAGRARAASEPEGNSVPAGRPPSLATIATLSRSCMRIVRGFCNESWAMRLPVCGQGFGSLAAGRWFAGGGESASSNDWRELRHRGTRDRRAGTSLVANVSSVRGVALERNCATRRLSAMTLRQYTAPCYPLVARGRAPPGAATFALGYIRAATSCRVASIASAPGDNRWSRRVTTPKGSIRTPGPPAESSVCPLCSTAQRSPPAARQPCRCLATGW